MTTTEHAVPSTVRPGMLLIMAAWFGALTGVLEVGWQAWRKLGEHEWLWLSRELVWMAPLGNALFFIAAGVLLLAVTRLRPSPRAAASLLSGLGALCLALQFETLHVLAALAIALGIGIQAGRLAGKRAAGFVRLVRRTAPWLAGLVVLLALTEGLWLGRAGVAAAAAPPRPGAPNVLLITMDTVRAQSLGSYGYGRPTTPQLERLAARGLRFERAFAPAPWTLPTHASLFTGRFPHELSVDWVEPLDAEHPTLAEALHARGWATAGFVANLNYCGYEAGLDRGFEHWDDYPVSFGQMVLSTALGRRITNSAAFRDLIGYRDNLNRKTAEDLNAAFLRWQSGVSDRPFFAFLNYYDAHSPYLPPPDFEGKFGPVVPRGPYRYETNMVHVEWEELTPAQIEMERDSYDAAIAYLDDCIGDLVDELERRGVLQSTLVVITADHGEQFGEHRLYDHGNSLYLQNVKVPLLVLFPGGARAGAVVERPVSLRDLAATVLDLLEVEGGHGVEGRSLARWWHADGSGDHTAGNAANIVLSELELPDDARTRMEALVAGRYQFIRTGSGTTELYDIESDPEQKIDLSRSRHGQKAVARFGEALNLILQGRR